MLKSSKVKIASELEAMRKNIDDQMKVWSEEVRKLDPRYTENLSQEERDEILSKVLKADEEFAADYYSSMFEITKQEDQLIQMQVALNNSASTIDSK